MCPTAMLDDHAAPPSPALDRLCAALDRPDRPLNEAEINRALSGLDISPADLAAHVHFGADHYARTRVRHTAHYEVLVLCWRPGQRSPIHDHAGSACGVRVLSGVATETQYVIESGGQLRPIGAKRAGRGAVLATEDDGIHRLGNEHPSRDLITLHVYSPPLAAMQTFSPADVLPFCEALSA